MYWTSCWTTILSCFIKFLNVLREGIEHFEVTQTGMFQGSLRSKSFIKLAMLSWEALAFESVTGNSSGWLTDSLIRKSIDREHCQTSFLQLIGHCASKWIAYNISQNKNGEGEIRYINNSFLAKKNYPASSLVLRACFDANLSQAPLVSSFIHHKL
jgi:hypothetical protein